MCSEFFDKQGKQLKMEEWGKLLTNFEYKVVKQTTLPDGTFISTIWLGLCHTSNPYHTNHLIFETMMFLEKGNFEEGDEGDQERYSSEEDALNGHYKMCLKYSPFKASNTSTMQKKKLKQLNKKPVKKVSKKK